MTACFAALDDERVDAGHGRLLCLGRRGDGAPDAAPRRLQFRDDVAAGATEGEGDDRRLLPTEQLELRLPGVVGPPASGAPTIGTASNPGGSLGRMIGTSPCAMRA